ncbi:MAG TPA: gliding motility-associated C-terminal domain-containing protein [Saprospiraceae bacterium]|nr:gliding motility-associated C-terminal domain-containing protein [Saprospiraceae bacterium]
MTTTNLKPLYAVSLTFKSLIIVSLFVFTNYLHGQGTPPVFNHHRTLVSGVDYQISTSQIVTGLPQNSIPSALSDIKNPYLHIQLAQNQNVSYVEINLSRFTDQEIMNSNIYLLASATSSGSPLLNAYVNNNAQLYQQVIKSKLVLISLNYANYKEIGIYSNKAQMLSANDVRLVVGSNSVGPGTGPGPGPEPFMYEINCANGGDDDKDGFVDCQDSDCVPTLDYFNVVQPTCPICNDGSIYLVHYLPTFRDRCYYSIDNGITWASTTTSYITFNNLSAGTFTILMSYFSGEGNICVTTPFVITLNQPPIGRDEYCNNGGFEHGNFDNWNGGTGTCVDPAWTATQFPLTIINNGLAINSLHTIIAANPNAFDPNVGANLPLASPNGGVYLMRLGDIASVEPSAENVTYNFIVDNNNKDFKFYYAFVSEAAHSLSTINGRYQYLIRNLTEGKLIHDSREIFADLGNQFFLTHNTFVYKGWTCHHEDLSEYIGDEIQVEFIVGDCIQGGHYAYAYLDGLCSQPVPLDIQCNLENEVFCQGQSPMVSVTGTGYNKYQWTISKIRNDGTEYDKKELDVKVGYDATADGVMDEYLQTGTTFECTEYLFTLKVFNDCGETGTCSFKSKSSCAVYDIDYCDYMPVCTSANASTIQIPANFDCNGCTYKWSPSQYFQGTAFDKSPAIHRTIFTDALQRDYVVEVTTQEGCMYLDTVRVREQGFSVELDTTIGTCNIEITLKVIFDFPVPDSSVDIKVTDTQNSVTYTPAFPTGQSTDRIKIYNVRVSRGFQYGPELEYVVTTNYNGQDYCQIGERCAQKGYIGKFGANIFPNAWYSYIPNAFSPDHDGINDVFHPIFSTFVEVNNCSKRYAGSSIYWAELKIFDRWGEEVFSKTASVDPDALVGLRGDELAWDGTFRGEPMNPAVFAWELEIRSCTRIAPCSNINCPQEDGEFCSFFGDNNRLLKGDIQLFR